MIENYQKSISDVFINQGPRIIIVLAFFVFGLWLIGILVRFLKNHFFKRNYQKTTSIFFINIIGIGLRIILVVVVLAQMGVATKSLAAILGAAGVAIGLSLQSSLSNIAGGFIIVFFSYFKVGDWIETQDGAGHVREIRLFSTKIVDLDNKSYVIPNNHLSNGSLVNFSNLGEIRLEIPIGIAYSSNIKLARESLASMMKNHHQVMQSPEPSIKVKSFGDNAIQIILRPWVKTTDPWWDVYFDIIEEAKLTLDSVGITIPFPQRVVHIKKD